MTSFRPWLAACLLLVSTLPAWAGADPVFSGTGPDAAAYGADEGYPVGTQRARPPQKVLVGTFSHYDQVFPSRVVAKPDAPSPLRRADAEIALTYRFRDASYGLQDYLDRNPVTGLLIARGDEILFEHYRYARTDTERLTSHSMAKTVTAMLLGIAVEEGAIRSIDQPAADYVPELAGTEYGKTPIRALLHMSSGVKFKEAYDGTGDNSTMSRLLFTSDNPGAAAAVAQFNTRDAPPDTRFYYAGAETEVLGLVVARATGQSLADYLRSRIWQKIGAEADASWIVDTRGVEVAYCCFNAVLRDWARLGMMLANDGMWNGTQIVPRDWLLAATTVASGDPHLAPQPGKRLFGYGYQVWIFPGPRRQFALLGIHGQSIFVDPAAHLVMVQTAAWVNPTGSRGETIALWQALAALYAE
ncbi:MAG: serine hydrolase domain-containing protein [Alphaproteobacteria bacterium]